MEPLSSRSENENGAYRRHLIATSSADELRIEVKRLDERLEATEGERDRLREAATKLLEGCWQDRLDAHEALQELDAALSTGDRQEQTFGGTGEAVARPLRDGHETEGGASYDSERKLRDEALAEGRADIVAVLERLWRVRARSKQRAEPADKALLTEIDGYIAQLIEMTDRAHVAEARVRELEGAK